MSDKNRLIPDAECAQSKCARKTTGCWGECNIKRDPILYGIGANIAAVYVVAAQPAPIPAQTGTERASFAAPTEQPCSLRRTGTCSCPTACKLNMQAVMPQYVIAIPAAGPNRPTNEAETRMDTGFSGGPKPGVSAGNALTEEVKDAARYRFIRNNSRGELYDSLYCNKAEYWDAMIDAAIASHIKAGKEGS